jgi:hypothetical protein
MINIIIIKFIIISQKYSLLNLKSLYPMNNVVLLGWGFKP